MGDVTQLMDTKQQLHGKRNHFSDDNKSLLLLPQPGTNRQSRVDRLITAVSNQYKETQSTQTSHHETIKEFHKTLQLLQQKQSKEFEGIKQVIQELKKQLKQQPLQRPAISELRPPSFYGPL